jgi:type II secretion system protein J
MIAKAKQSAGFTLIEILLSIGILATISVFAIQALSSQIEHRNKLEQKNASYHAIHVAMTRIYDDFANITVAAETGARASMVKQALVWTTKGGYFTTQNFRSFVAGAPQADLAQVRYSVKDDPKDPAKKQLWRTVDNVLQNSIEYEDTGISQVIVDDVDKFEVQFWDGQDFSNQGDWDTTSSNFANKLPKMARIVLSIFTTELESEKQLRELDSGKADKPREKIQLETIVYLLKSADQQQLKEPAGEYKWR